MGGVGLVINIILWLMGIDYLKDFMVFFRFWGKKSCDWLVMFVTCIMMDSIGICVVYGVGIRDWVLDYKVWV